MCPRMCVYIHVDIVRARAGVHLTTYESALFELMGDSKAENFKAVSSLIKETRPDPPLPFLHVSTI